MKIFNKLSISGLFILFLFGGACSDELVRPTPPSLLTDENAFSSANTINAAVLGIYSTMQTKVQEEYVMVEVPTDNMYGAHYEIHPGLAGVEKLTVAVDNAIVNNYWKRSYNAIYSANQVLSNIDNPTDYKESQKEQYIGEARFLRALYYFDLVRLFGDVPLVLERISIEESKQTPRTPQKQILDQIIEDLKEAVAGLPLPSEIERGRASKAAAASLLGEVYIYQKKWGEAKEYFAQVVNDYNYSLVPNFGDLFNLKTEENSEAIFSVTFVAGINGQNLMGRFVPLSGVLGIKDGGAREVRPTYDLQKMYDNEDTRFQETIATGYIPFNGSPDDEPIYYPYISKYNVPQPKISSGLDIPTIRLGDIILLYSETLYKTGHPEEALKQLNRIRERAFHDSEHNYQMRDFTDEKSFMDLLLKERRLELAFENKRWFDLVRTERMVNVLTEFEEEYGGTGDPIVVNLNPQPYRQYFPIPYQQIQQAPDVLTQNEGY